MHKASLDLKPQEVISTQSSKQEEIIKPEKIALKDIKQQNNKASFKKTSTFSQKQDIEIKTSIEQKQQGVVSHFSKQTETIKQTVQKEPMSIGLNTSKAKPEFVSITQKVEDINKPEKIVSNKMSTESFTHTNIKQEPDVKFFSKQNSVEVSKPLSKQTEEIVKPEKIVSNKPTTESSIHRNIKQEPEVKDTLVQKQNDSAKQSQVQPKIDEKLGNDAYLSESFKANKVTDMANNNGTVTNKKVDRSIKAVQINTDSLQRKNDMSGIKPMPSIIAKEQYTVLQNTVSPVFTEKREDQRVVIQPVNNIKKSKNISFNTKPKEAEQVKTAESVKPNQLNESKSMDKKVAFTANEINKNQSDYSIKNKENFIPNSIKMEKNIQSQTTENIEPIQQPKHDVQRERSMTNDMAQQMHNKPYEARISSFERMKGMEDMHSFEDGVNVQKGINADIVQDYIDKNEPFIIHYFDNDGQERQKTVF
ncbi:MAG TPA: hypothetical protein PKZ69_08060, partial [Candidatus Cloacimonadota bacterium]|nr:hypothetical protein [Candidatus Cloacimonadota bacterium]